MNGQESTLNPYYAALVGGALIGLAAAMLLYFNGRIFGVSGITGGMLRAGTRDYGWRITAVLGLIAGVMAVAYLDPSSIPLIPERPVTYAIAGLLVGFGTQLGSGCTSGHGVCGISRFSVRGLVATITFMITGVIAVLVWGN